MKFISELQEGSRIRDIYLCKYKQAAVTKNGKQYENVILQDKTGTIDAKIWETNSPGIQEFEALDYVQVVGDVTSFNGTLQVSIKQLYKASEGEYEPADYLPISNKNIDEMYEELVGYINSIGNPYLKALLERIFVEDGEFAKIFKFSSAAKSVHHGFVGGLLEHTLSVTKFCEYLANTYPIINRDLLYAAAMCHDVAKTKELSPFPMNDYTDEGQLLGHITMGVQMLQEGMNAIPGFPRKIGVELMHCILAHHGELEYGSPKKPALVEAVALNMADNTDSKMQTLTEIFDSNYDKTDWLGYNRLFESNLRRSTRD